MTQEQRDGPANIFPEIAYDDAPAALEWLARAFGFVLGEVIEGSGGTIAHADAFTAPGQGMPKSAITEAEFTLKSPRSLQGISQCLHVTVQDTDAHHRKRSRKGRRRADRHGAVRYGLRSPQLQRL